jgi:hypothetical protein
MGAGQDRLRRWALPGHRVASLTPWTRVTAAWPELSGWRLRSARRTPWQPCRRRPRRACGLLRQYLPRTADLRRFSQADLDHIAAELNGRPRQILGFRHPHAYSRRRRADSLRPPSVLRPAAAPHHHPPSAWPEPVSAANVAQPNGARCFCDGHRYGPISLVMPGSTADQQPHLQVHALARAGCYRPFTQTASGTATARPALDQVLDQLRPGRHPGRLDLDRWAGLERQNR